MNEQTPPHWVHLQIHLPDYLGGVKFDGMVPKNVRDGILMKLSHKQFYLAAQWLNRHVKAKS